MTRTQGLPAGIDSSTIALVARCAEFAMAFLPPATFLLREAPSRHRIATINDRIRQAARSADPTSGQVAVHNRQDLPVVRRACSDATLELRAPESCVQRESYEGEADESDGPGGRTLGSSRVEHGVKGRGDRQNPFDGHVSKP